MKPGFRKLNPALLIDQNRNYRLVSTDGLYLHQSCLTLCRDKAWAWEGTAEQLNAVKRLHPIARALHAQRLPAAPFIEPLRKGERL